MVRPKRLAAVRMTSIYQSCFAKFSSSESEVRVTARSMGFGAKVVIHSVSSPSTEQRMVKESLSQEVVETAVGSGQALDFFDRREHCPTLQA